MRRFPAGFAVVAILLIATQAYVIDDAGIGRPIRWNLVPPFDTDSISTNVVNPTTRAIRYYLGSEGWSAANRSNELNALRASFAQWQAIPGTALKFEDAGLVGPGADINTFDNTNVVYFAKTSFVNGGRDSLSGAAGRTYISWFTDNNDLAESDIVFNGLEASWFTDIFDANTLAKFIDGVALHEIGHMVGLFHTPVGAGTMYHAGDQGLMNLQSGLAADDVAGARALYPLAATASSYGHLRGLVTLNAAPVLGAAVFLENAAGNMEAGTVTRADGIFDISFLKPGDYTLRVAPLDPSGSLHYLARGREISTYFSTNAVNSTFLPTGNRSVTVTANVTNISNFTVSAGTPAFRIGHIRTPTTNPNIIGLNRAPVAVRPGQSNVLVGVLSPTLPTSGATLTIPGDGVSLSGLAFNNTTFPGTNLISVTLNVSTNATPGLRSFLVTRTSDGSFAWANGFLEILPAAPDNNYDGLNDLFQRRWFSLFTAPEAGPAADPDGDGYTNLQEYQGGGTNPKLASAYPLVIIDRVTLGQSGATVVWSSVPDKRYQLQRRDSFSGATWQSVGAPVTATGLSTEAPDASATTMRFYRVQVLP